MNERLIYVFKKFGLVFLVIILSFSFLLVGLMIGYGFIGGGEKPTSILSLNHWNTIINKFTGK